MILLAIDPGPTETAWAFLVDGKLSRDYPWWGGERSWAFGKEENAWFLDDVVRRAAKMEDIEVVIEKVEHYGKDMHAGQTTFETCVWSGRFQQAFLDAWGYDFSVAYDPEPWHRLGRREVKRILLGMGAAKDGDIRTAVIDRLGMPGTKKQPGPTYGVSKDVWQAIGLGLAWLDLNEKGGG